MGSFPGMVLAQFWHGGEVEGDRFSQPGLLVRGHTAAEAVTLAIRVGAALRSPSRSVAPKRAISTRRRPCAAQASRTAYRSCPRDADGGRHLGHVAYGVSCGVEYARAARTHGVSSGVGVADRQALQTGSL